MNKVATWTNMEEREKARAQGYLAETQRMLWELAAERRRVQRPSLVVEVRVILQGA